MLSTKLCGTVVLQDKFPLAYSDWTKAFGKLASIEVWLEEVDVADPNSEFGYAPRQQHNDPTKVVQWYCEKIVVRDRRKGAAAWEYFYFPMQRWLYPGKHYLVQHLNVALPQFDVLNQIPSSNPAPDGAGAGAGSEREQEISENRRMYLYEQKAHGLPVQVPSFGTTCSTPPPPFSYLYIHYRITAGQIRAYGRRVFRAHAV